MKRKLIIDRIAWVPAWGLSLFAALVAAVVLSILKDYVEEPTTYIIWSLLLASASFLICIVHPNHVFLVPFLCNILVILPSACDNTFWTTSFGIIIGSGVVLSVITAHIGALLGKKQSKLTNNEPKSNVSNS